MIDDDAPFLVAPGGGELGFRQGTVVAWNTTTGANTVTVGGATLTNVPFMRTGSFVTYSAGDPIILLRQGASWTIWSQIVAPGGTLAIGRNTQAAAGYSASSSNFATTTLFVTQVTLSIPVPVWANAATAQVTLMAVARNSTAAKDQMACRISMPDGATSTQNSSFVATTDFVELTIGKAWGPVTVTPGGTLTILGQILSGAAWAVNASNAMTVDAFVMWNSN